MLALLLATAAGISAPAAPPDTAAIAPVLQELAVELVPGRAEWSGSLRAKLVVRRATRRFALRLAGADPSRVELNDAHGPVALTFGWRGRDTLVVETRAPLAPGPAGLNVAFFSSEPAAPNAPRPAAGGAVALRPGRDRGLPEWPAPAPVTPWRLRVNVPDSCAVRAPLRFTGSATRHGWRSFLFESRRSVPLDSIAFEVRPRTRVGAGPKVPPRR